MVKPFIIVLLNVLSGYIFSFFYKRERERFEKSLNDYLYYIALPLTIFIKIIEADISAINIKIILLNSIPLLIIYFLIYLLFLFKTLTASFARTLMITSTLGNLVYLGFGIVSLNFGEKNLFYAVISTTVQNIIIFTAGVFFINLVCYENSCIIVGLRKSFLNPIFISTCTSLIFKILKINLHEYFEEVFKQISTTTLPLAVFLIGFSLYGKKVNQAYLKKVFAVFLFKMILVPLTAFFYIYFAGLFDKSSSVTFVLYTMPVAVACYVIADDFVLEKDTVVGAIFFTTISYFLMYWIYFKVIVLFF